MKCLDFKPDHNGECLNCDGWWEEHIMPSIPEEERAALLGIVGSCTRCKSDLLRHYCRTCDEFFHTCACLSTIQNVHLQNHRIYLWTKTVILAIPDFDTFQLEAR